MSRKKIKRKNRLLYNGKVHLHVLIDKELYEKVSVLAPKVYGVVRGALSCAVEEALEYWLSAHTTAHRVNPRLPLRERYNAVVKCIELEYGMVPITIHQIFLEKCIADTFNVKDPRSIYGWLHRFYLAGLIKPLTIEKPLKPSDWSRNKTIELVAKKV